MKARKSLRIENIEISVDDEILCTAQRLEARGLCGVVGAHSELRRALLSLLTRPAAPDIANLKFCGDIFCDDSPVEYSELLCMMNPFTMFYSEETVSSSLEFVNFFGAKSLMAVFDLARLQNIPISRLSVSESRAWEAAVNVASNSKIIVLKDFQTAHEQKKRYLSFLRDHARVQRCIIFVEIDCALESEFDGCIVVGQDSLECIDLTSNAGTSRSQDIFLHPLQDGSSRHSLCIEDRVVHRMQPRTEHPRRKRSPRAEPELQCRSNRNTTTLERIFNFYFYSINLRSSLVLARRKYMFKERRVDDLKKFFLSILVQIYLAVLVKFKGSILQNMFDFVFTIPRFLYLVLGILKVGLSFIMSPLPRRSFRMDIDIVHLASRLLSSMFSPVVFFGSRTQSFFSTVRTFTWDSADYKIISTGIYFLVFMKGGSIINEERAQIYRYVNRIYSPGTYFAYIFAYLVLTTWIPVLLISYALNLGFALVFLLTGTFVCSLLNLTSNMKFKYLCVSVVLAFNLLYPLNHEHHPKGFFFKYSESFNLLVTCRELPFVSAAEHSLCIYRLFRAFAMIYIFFCYKFSKV